jgi:CO/xanthine dehydrogenase FAD-binding subunit
MQPFELIRPSSEGELMERYAKGGCVILAGGTDLLPRLRRQNASPPVVIDISRLSDLDFIRVEDGRLEIGALTRQADLACHPLVALHAPALSQAAASVGCPQTRARATLGGNLANASPAADTLPPLLTLDASLRLIGKDGARELALGEFLLGPGRTALQPGEYIHSVSFPLPSERARGGFYKLGKRSGMVIAVASAAVLVDFSADGRIACARVALGSVAPTAVRCPSVEAALLGRLPAEVDLEAIAALVLDDIAPIVDVRATAEYRRSSARVILRRVLESILS